MKYSKRCRGMEKSWQLVKRKLAVGKRQLAVGGVLARI